MMLSEVSVWISQIGLLERIKTYLSKDSFIHLFQNSKQRCIEMGIYMGVGFVCGFLIKRYAHYVAVTVIGLIALVLLQEVDCIHITVKWQQLQDYVGLRFIESGSDGITGYWYWMKHHFTVVLSFVVGFLVGLKLG